MGATYRLTLGTTTTSSVPSVRAIRPAASSEDSVFNKIRLTNSIDMLVSNQAWLNLICWEGHISSFICWQLELNQYARPVTTWLLTLFIQVVTHMGT